MQTVYTIDFRGLPTNRGVYGENGWGGGGNQGCELQGGSELADADSVHHGHEGVPQGYRERWTGKHDDGAQHGPPPLPGAHAGGQGQLRGLRSEILTPGRMDARTVTLAHLSKFSLIKFFKNGLWTVPLEGLVALQTCGGATTLLRQDGVPLPEIYALIERMGLWIERMGRGGGGGGGGHLDCVTTAQGTRG